MTMTAKEAENKARGSVERAAEQSHILGWRQRHFDALARYADIVRARALAGSAGWIREYDEALRAAIARIEEAG